MVPCGHGLGPVGALCISQTQMSDILSINVTNIGGRRLVVVRSRDNVTHFLNLDELDEDARLKLLCEALTCFVAEHPEARGVDFLPLVDEFLSS
jgi:hypothetical protein